VFRRFLLWGGAQFAAVMGYPSDYTDFTMTVRGGSGVRMVYSCMGFGLIAAFAALVLAWPARLKNKLISLGVGIAIIIILNMIRIGGLAVLFSNGYYEHFDFINHHDLFNVVVVVLIFLFFAWHVRRGEKALLR
jgi:exosortase/archaeosortase family protein